MSADNTPGQIRNAPVFGISAHGCPECGERFALAAPRQIFCCTAHKREWETRASVRARQLFPYSTAARLTRDGTRGDKETGRWAARAARQLIQAWRDEDRKAKPPRMSAVEYAAVRRRLGYDAP